jgi:putative membrane protein
MLAAILDTSEVNDPMSDFHPGALLNAIVYAALGILIFAAAFVTIDKMTPYHLWKEIVEDKNIALAVLVGAMSIGMCIIIAAAVH